QPSARPSGLRDQHAVHGDCAVWRLRPEGMTPVFRMPGTDAYRLAAEQRAPGTELGTADGLPRVPQPEGFCQNQRLQWPVHDQSRIAANLGGVGQIVVNAVRIERK